MPISKERLESMRAELAAGRVVSYNGRTAATDAELEFIARAEGISQADAEAGHDERRGEDASPVTVTTASGLDAMKVKIGNASKAVLIEVAKALGISPVPEKSDALREAIHARREALKAVG